LNRRNFLRAAGVGLGSAVALLFPDLPAIAGTVVETTRETVASSIGQGTPDATYAGGTVIAITRDGMVLSSAQTQRPVRVSATTGFWKETVVDFAAVQLGDHVDAFGVPEANGVLHAAKVDVNLVRFDGIIETNDAQRITLRLTRGGTAQVALSPFIEVVNVDDASPRKGGVHGLSRGVLIGGVGVRTADGQRRATRIWAGR
jgi:hypothetical protein